MVSDEDDEPTDTTSECPGAGQRWRAGTGAPICPACRRGPRGLGVAVPTRRAGRFTGLVPAHQRRTR